MVPLVSSVMININGLSAIKEGGSRGAEPAIEIEVAAAASLPFSSTSIIAL